MDYVSTVKTGFEDELNKIAGFLRAGRRPFRADTLLKRMPAVPKVEKKATMVKTSEGVKAPKASSLGKGKLLRYGTVAGLGILGYDQVRKAKRDWQTGRQMRIQQGY